jgi:hypothetical protein
MKGVFLSNYSTVLISIFISGVKTRLGESPDLPACRRPPSGCPASALSLRVSAEAREYTYR